MTHICALRAATSKLCSSGDHQLLPQVRTHPQRKALHPDAGGALRYAGHLNIVYNASIHVPSINEGSILYYKARVRGRVG